MITSQHNTLRINNKKIQFNYTIINIVEFDNIILVLLESASCVQQSMEYSNLYAFDRKGEKIWIASLSNHGPYYKILIENDKIVALAPSYDCIIDRTTGQIVKELFTK